MSVPLACHEILACGRGWVCRWQCRCVAGVSGLDAGLGGRRRPWLNTHLQAIPSQRVPLAGEHVSGGSDGYYQGSCSVEGVSPAHDGVFPVAQRGGHEAADAPSWAERGGRGGGLERDRVRASLHVSVDEVDPGRGAGAARARESRDRVLCDGGDSEQLQHQRDRCQLHSWL